MSDSKPAEAEGGDRREAGPRYRWTFDKRGRRIDREASGTRHPAAGPLSANRAETNESERVLEWLTRHSDSGLDLELLERMQVVPSPPSWSFVRAGIERLRAGAAPVESADRAEILNAIQMYMTNVTANAEPLETAVYCAMVLSWFVPEQRGPTLRRALEVLEQSLQRGTSRDERLRILQIVGESMSKLAPRSPLENVRGFLVNAQLANWMDALMPIRANLIASVDKDAYDVSRLAWQDWRSWAVRLWPSPPALTELSIWNMASRAAESLPGAILRDDPTGMPIAEWTAAFRKALHEEAFHLNEIRGWFIPLALAQLGFPEQAATYLARNRPPGPEMADFTRRIEGGSKRGQPCLILSLEPDTVATKWRPSPSIGCLAGDSGDMSEAVRDLIEVSVKERPAFSYLFVGVKGVPTDAQQTQGLVHAMELRQRFPECQTMRLVFVGGQPRARGVTLSAYYLENTPTLEEAVQQLDRLPSTTWRESRA